MNNWIARKMKNLSGFCTHCSAFARDGLETGFDTCDGTSWATRLALQEEETRVLLQYCFWWAAGVAGDVLFDVSEISKEPIRNLKRKLIQVRRTFSKRSQSASAGIFLWWWAESFRQQIHLFPTQRAKSPKDVSVVLKGKLNYNFCASRLTRLEFFSSCLSSRG